MAFLAAASAASWAANGVPMGEPLKPTEPALHHASTFLTGSVIVMMLLLNVEWMCATPSLAIFLAFFRFGATAGFSAAFSAGLSAPFAALSSLAMANAPQVPLTSEVRF